MAGAFAWAHRLPFNPTIMIKVTFKKDYELSPDGINTRVYKKDQTYTATYGQEENVFRHAIASGLAVNAQDAGSKQVKNKVAAPTKRKSKSTRE